MKYLNKFNENILLAALIGNKPIDKKKEVNVLGVSNKPYDSKENTDEKSEIKGDEEVDKEVEAQGEPEMEQPQGEPEMEVEQGENESYSMKYLKTFEAYGKIDSDIHEDIAVSILPEMQKLKSEKGYYTVEDFEAYMKERGADDIMINSVMNYLVSMDFDFDTEPEEELPEGWEDEIKLVYKDEE
jgi:hypothetical protein